MGVRSSEAHKDGLVVHEARIEAERCLFCYDAPCARACPTAIDVAGFIRKIATGNLLGATRRLLDANPLAASCGRVCPTEELCERACVLPDLGGRPVAIGHLQRYVMDWAMDRGAPPISVGEASAGRVAVVGAGPAGLACATELRRLGYDVTLFDARDRPGGLATFAIADHKMTAEFAQLEAHWLSRVGFEIQQGVRVGKDIPWTRLEEDFDRVFLGLGQEGSVKMEVPGEDLDGVVDALDLIATHRVDAPLPVSIQGQDVLVIGGGNTATDAALLALELDARSSTIVYRRTRAEMPAYPSEQRLALDKGVGFRFLFSPVRVMGDKDVTGLECQPMRLGTPDRSGRRRPEPLEAPTVTLSGQVVVRAIGQTLQGGLPDTDPPIKISKGRIIVAPETGQTANSRYYAGGDCVNGGREVVHAAADGRRAAHAIHQALSGRKEV